MNDQSILSERSSLGLLPSDVMEGKNYNKTYEKESRISFVTMICYILVFPVNVAPVELDFLPGQKKDPPTVGNA